MEGVNKKNTGSNKKLNINPYNDFEMKTNDLSMFIAVTVGAAPAAALNQLEWMWKWPQMMKKVKCSKMKTKGLPLMTAITHPFIQQGTITCNDEVASLLYFSSNGLCAC